jgi:aspartate kinase
MTTIVQKFGGTSVGDAERIQHVAEQVAATARKGHRVCVVVSAMGKSTDELIALANQVSSRPQPRELDMLLTAGERISMALLSMAIDELGQEAISFTGSQAGILTDTAHGRARIVEVRGRRVSETLAAGKIAIVAGFQGISAKADVTTLGRGGSDTTAVALAAYLGADSCEIYTDVDGVYTADPRVEPTARKLDELAYEEMLELSSCGARVLMARSVEYARNHDVPIHVRSSFADTPGTWVRKESDLMEKAIISGIAHDTSEAKVTIASVPDRPGIAARLFRALADAGVNIDMIVQNIAAGGQTDISFTVPRTDLDRAEELLASIAEEIGAAGVLTDRNVGKVSLIGVGMRSHPGVAARTFEALAEADINIEIISTSSIRISCVVKADDVERAVQVIHEAFRLSDEVVYEEESPAAAAAE